MTCCAIASPPFSPWCMCTICFQISAIAYDSYNDCNNANIVPMTIAIFLVHHGLLLPRLRHTDCNCTRMNRAAPMSPSIPNRNHVCNFDFCTPVDKKWFMLNYLRKCISLCISAQRTIWLQPPSFSMVTLHFGHSFVLAAIQLDVSESSSHFLIHFFK